MGPPVFGGVWESDNNPIITTFIRQALNMYSEGGSVSAVARAMDINFATVFTWVKKSELGSEGIGHRA